MSTKITHTLTVTETTSSMPACEKLAFNVKVLKTKNGLLKLFEMILGIACMAVIVQGNSPVTEELSIAILAFFLCVTSCLLVAFLLLVSYLISPATAETLPKIIFELLHNVVSFLFYTSSSLAVLIIVSKAENETDENFIVLIVLGLVNSALYFVSSYYSYHSFKCA